MAESILEKGFSIWRTEADELTSLRFLPDGQIPIIALAGVYIATAPNTEKNAKAWRKTILSDAQTLQVLKRAVPYGDEYLEDDWKIPLIEFESSGLMSVSGLQARFEAAAVMDGVQPDEMEITASEHFLSNLLGQAAHNEAISFSPLRLNMEVARPPLHDFFPNCLEFIEETAA